MTLRWNTDFDTVDADFRYVAVPVSHNSNIFYENTFYCKPVKYDVDSTPTYYTNKSLFSSHYWLTNDITRHTLSQGADE
jgi:hypothetical protein